MFRRCAVAALTLTACAAATLAGTAPVAAVAGTTPVPAAAEPVPPAVAWLAQSYGVTPAEAHNRLSTERAHDRVADRLAKRLGDAAAGAWLEPDTGDLVVGVAESSRALGAIRTVYAAGARPRLVPHSSAELRAAKRQLDAHAAQRGSGRAVSWYVDQPRNAVVVDVAERRRGRAGETKAFLALARSLGDAVVIRPVSGQTAPHDDLLGGQEMDTDDNRVCSVGFHAVGEFGHPVLLTAGHCGRNTTEFSRDGRWVGRVAAARFPVDDFAVVWLEGGGWTAQPWVDRYDAGAVAVGGASIAVVGSTVCKSGASTKWTCGRIVAHDVTVSYDEGDTVYGLIQTSACSQGGDSGGPLLAGEYAQGLLSGGRSIQGECLERYGLENVSYFQPVAEPLKRYGLRLLTAPERP